MATRAQPDAFKLLAAVALNESQKANVFISSRMSYRLFGEELRGIRKELKTLLQTACPSMNVELAEDWTAGRKGSPRDLSIAGARWSDLMIGIFVDGAGYRDTAGLHATEMELATALDDSWDKVVFFAHKGLVDNLEAQPAGYRELIKRVMAYKDGKNVSVFDAKEALFQTVFDAVAGHVASAMRRYPSRTSGKGVEQAEWELMTFTERHEAIHDAFRKEAGDIRHVGAVASLKFLHEKKEHAFYRMSVSAQGESKVTSVPAILSVCPDRFSFAEAARFVGYPFRTMTEGWTDPMGPLHVVCIYRSITDAQIRRHLGNPDIRVAKEQWGYFARDPERSIQSLYLTKCEDFTSLRSRLRDALDWLTSTELTQVLETAEARGRILAATSARAPGRRGG